jgi:hypothetical protein
MRPSAHFSDGLAAAQLLLHDSLALMPLKTEASLIQFYTVRDVLDGCVCWANFLLFSSVLQGHAEV